MTRWLFLFLMVCLISCTKKDTNESILFEVQNNIDHSRWSQAIDDFPKLTPDVLGQRSTKNLLASAYAGRCGLNYVKLVTDLLNIDNTRLFLFLMQTFAHSTLSQMADCIAAESIIQTLGATPDLRSLDENLFLVFLSFTKIGTILNLRAETLGGPNPDPSFNSCSTSSLTDQDAAQIVTALGHAAATLTYIASTTSIGLAQAITLQTVCGVLSQAPIPSSFNFCGVTDTASVTSDQLKGIRSMIGENQYVGVGSCGNSLAMCLCY